MNTKAKLKTKTKKKKNEEKLAEMYKLTFS